MSDEQAFINESTASELTHPERLGPALVAATGDDRWAQHSASLITGGKSNLTFELRSEAGSLILRRPPTGHLLPRAHDMHREARVQRALAGNDVPVATVVLAEAEAHTLDVPFYVMTKVEGVIPRATFPTGYADAPKERLAVTNALIDGLVALHRVDPAAVGLADYGRTEGFAQRQVRTWTRQWEATRTAEVPAMSELGTRLAEHAWTEPERASIVHGDYRFDNCVFATTDPGHLAAVLDWELSTLGDPLADLGLLLFYWVEAGDSVPLLTPAPSRDPGFPTRRHLLDRYADATQANLTDIASYVALAHFKFAAIAQGVATRAAAGQMAGQDFGDLGLEIERIAAAGVAALNEGN